MFRITVTAMTLALALMCGVANSGESALAKCAAHPIYVSDGTNCETVTITNTSQDATSNQTVSVKWVNGNSSSIDIAKGQSTTFNCHITSIIVHETVATAGHVTWQ